MCRAFWLGSRNYRGTVNTLRLDSFAALVRDATAGMPVLDLSSSLALVEGRRRCSVISNLSELPWRPTIPLTLTSGGHDCGEAIMLSGMKLLVRVIMRFGMDRAAIDIWPVAPTSTCSRRRLMRGIIGGDAAAGADLVVDNRGAPVFCANLFTTRRRRCSIAAAGREADDEVDAPVRKIGLRACLARRRSAKAMPFSSKA